MNKNSLLKLILLSTIISIFSCSGNIIPPPITLDTAMDEWMKKYRPDVKKDTVGYYVNIYENHTDTTTLADTTFLEIKLTGRLLNGAYFMNYYKQRARELGTFSYETNYIPFKFQAKKYKSYAGMNIGIITTLQKMKAGDSAEIFLSPANAYGNDYSNSMYLGFGGSTKISSDKGQIVHITIKLDKMYADAEKLAEEETKKYAHEILGLTERDTIKPGLYFKKTKIISGGETLEKKDTAVQVNYSGYFTNGFLFDTSLDSVAKSHHVYDPYTKYVPLSFEHKIGADEFGDMIQAFKYCISKMKPGEKATFISSPKWAYGADGKYSAESTLIMAYTPLVFSIEIVAAEEF